MPKLKKFHVRGNPCLLNKESDGFMTCKVNYHFDILYDMKELTELDGHEVIF